MDKRAVDKAQERLLIAQEKLAEIATCTDYKAFCRSWYVLLTSAKNVYTQLEQGAKISPQSRQWFGGKKTFRRNDPLLQYMFQARDDNEHGVSDGTRLEPGGLGIGVRKPGYSRAVQIDGTTGPGGILTVQALDNKPVLVERIPPKAILVPVTGRGNVVYQPPTEHLGKPIADRSPFVVAQLALNYLSDLIAEARGLS